MPAIKDQSILERNTNHPAAISLTGSKQGAVDANRRDALKRGGI